MAEKSIFEEAEVLEEPTLEQEQGPQDEEDNREWNPTIANESPKDRLERLGTKAEADGKILTIKNVFFTRPKTRNQDGSKIEPKRTQDSQKEFYPGKLGIRFEEDNLVEYYPNFHYFLNDKGEVSKVAKINRGGDNAVTKIFKLVVAKMGKQEDEVADSVVFAFLPGKKVKIQTSKGKFQGKAWFRNDIVEIL
jgi:hypothetical protein